MKNSIKILAALGMLAITSPASAGAMDLYIGGAVGMGAMQVNGSDDTTFSGTGSFAGAFGINLPLFRVEAEYNYFTASKSGADLALQMAMVNAYIKPFAIPVIKPYFGAGAGAIIAGDIGHDVDANNTPAFQGMLGVSIDIPAMPIGFDVEGRVVYSPNAFEFKTMSTEYDILGYEARVKMRYEF